MKIAIVDDEPHAIERLEGVLKELSPDYSVYGFQFSEDFLAYLKGNKVDVAFLDIEMPDKNGLELAKLVKEMQKTTNIIFMTGHSQYSLEAHALYVTGYLLKPPTLERVLDALQNLRCPVYSSHERVWVQCFGNFEVFVDGTPLKFSRSKAKELLAYLVDRRGATVSIRQAAAVLYEDKPFSHKLSDGIHAALHDLRAVLKAAGIFDMVEKTYDSMRVDPRRFQCDYYGFLAADARAVNSYQGGYMENYSWAEFTAAALDSRLFQ